MTIWIDAQLSPSLAAWINQNFDSLTAHSVRSLGLRDAADHQIFNQARQHNAIIMTKDDDFYKMLDLHGPPPFIIWITCGNTSNAKMRDLLSKHLATAIQMIVKGESLIEIGEN